MVAHCATTLYTSHMAKRTRTTMNISLPAAQKRYIEKLVDSGKYQSASEVIRESIRELQENASRRSALHKKIQLGIDALRDGRSFTAAQTFAELDRRRAAARRTVSRRRSA